MGPRDTVFVVFSVLALASCSFQASCGGKKLDHKKGEAELARRLEEAGGVPAKVTCPAAKLEKGLVIECTTEMAGVPGKVKVTQTDDQGNVAFEMSAGYAFSSKLEQHISKQFKQRTGQDGTVDCGARVRAAVAGTRFACTARGPSGDTLTLEVTLTDAAGGFELEAVAPSAPVDPGP